MYASSMKFPQPSLPTRPVSPPRMIPSSTFQQFIRAYQLEEKDVPLQCLNRMPESNLVTLAFDGNKILDVMTESVRKSDPLSTFTICTPFNVYTYINEYCQLASQGLREYFERLGVNFKAVFVFNGCGFTPTADLDPVVPEQPTELYRYRAYVKTNAVRFVSPETARDNAWRFVIESDVEGMVVRRFREKCPDTFRAPYLAWSQLSAFLAPPNHYISDVYGCLELLAFPGVRRVITNIDEEKGTFDFVSKDAVLALLRREFGEFTEDDFAALVLMESKNRLFYIKNIKLSFEEMCRIKPQPLPTRAAAVFAQHCNPAQQALVQRNLAALDAPVMSCDGKCVYLCSLYGREKQSDVGVAFGRPLPSILYYFFFAGPIMPEALAAVSQSVLADNWPLVDSKFFRMVAQVILPLRVQVVYQLYHITRITPTLRWLRQYVVFRHSEIPEHRWSPIKQLSNITLTDWNVDPSRIAVNSDDGVYFSDVTRFATCAASEPVVYEGAKATATGVLLRTLDLLGYFTHGSTNVGSSGSYPLSIAVDRFVCPTLSEYGIMVIELVRTGTLTDDIIMLSTQETGEPYMSGIRFAARLLSIIPLNMEGPWSGPFDPEMAAFGVVTRMFSKTLRLLTEVLASLTFFTQSTTVPLEEFGEVMRLLPFSLPTEFNAGFLMTYVLLNPTCTIDDLKCHFPELYYLEDDLQTLFWFWTMSYDAIRYLCMEETQIMSIDILNDACKHVSDACRRLTPLLWEQLYRPMHDRLPELNKSVAVMNEMKNNMVGVPMGAMMPGQPTQMNGGYGMPF